MTAAEGMSTGEGDNFLVVESVGVKVSGGPKARANREVHTPYGKKSGGSGIGTIHCGEGEATYGAEVVVSLACIRETTVWGRILGEAIDATRAPRDLGATHFLPRDELPQIRSKYEIKNRPGRQRHHRVSRDRRSLSTQTPSLSPP